MTFVGLIDRIKRFGWQDWIVVLLIAFIVIFGLVIFSKFQHLPGPIYGGDLYSHYGYAQNDILNGFWSDPYYPGELPTYPWFGHLLIIIFKTLTGTTLMNAFLFFPIISMSLTLIIHYFLGIQIFKNKTLALGLGALALVMFGIVDGHPNLLPWMIEIPLFLLFWLRFEEQGLRLDQLLMGVMLGIIGLTHVAKFIAVLSVFGLFLIFELIRTRKLWELIKRYAPILIVAAIISAPFYFPNMLAYRGEVKNPVFQYNLPLLSEMGIGWRISETWTAFFYGFGNMGFIIKGILGLLGLGLVVAYCKKRTNSIFLIWFIAGLIVPLHHLITAPLFGRWILPYHLSTLSLPILVFTIMGAKTIFVNFDKYLGAFSKYFKFALLILLLTPIASARFNDFNNNQWVQYGRQLDPLTKSWLEFGDWAKQNTEPNSVFLANDESSFAINAVSARKLMIVRRTHANYFVDIDKRIADAAVVLYGNNSALRKQLLEEYDVSYVLYDPMLFSGELKTRPEFESLLKQNGVRFERKMDRLDPSIANAMQFDLLIIPPQNISADFQLMLKPIKQFGAEKQPLIMVFELQK